MSGKNWRIRDVRSGRVTRVIGDQTTADMLAFKRSVDIRGRVDVETRSGMTDWRVWQKYDDGTRIY